MTVVDWFLIPFRPLNWRAWCNRWYALSLVLYIEPLGFPVDYLVTKLIGDIHFVLPLSKLETCTSYYI